MSIDLRKSLNESRENYDALGQKLKQAIEDILDRESITRVSVAYRVKTTESALGKSSKMSTTVSSASDLYDFLGVRVITYFTDHVNDVAALIRQHFTVNEDYTKDKRREEDAERFGYASVHLVATINPERSALPDWSRFKGMKVEFQLRSSLQHSWAEIEHDLGYKSAVGAIPQHFRRRFSRLSGLLEIADDEFVALRTELASYRAEVVKSLDRGEVSDVDLESIMALVESSQSIRLLDQRIAGPMGSSLTNADVGYIQTRTEEFLSVGLNRTDAILAFVDENLEAIAKIARTWLETSHEEQGQSADQDDSGKWMRLPSGIGLFYVYLVTLATEGEEALLQESVFSRRPDRVQEFRTLCGQYLPAVT